MLRLLESEREIHDVLPELSSAEECGIDCQAARAMIEQSQRQIAAIRERYAPL